MLDKVSHELFFALMNYDFRSKKSGFDQKRHVVSALFQNQSYLNKKGGGRKGTKKRHLLFKWPQMCKGIKGAT